MSAPHVHSATCGCGADAKQLAGALESLLPVIDTERVWALNELVAGSAKNVFKPHDQRADEKRVLLSNADDGQLILHVPFTSEVKVRSFALIAAGDKRPTKCKIFVNREDVDFAMAGESKAFAQETALAPDTNASVEYPTKAAKFQNVSSLTFFFPSVAAGEQMQINYLVLKGESTKNKRQAVNVVYESVPNVKDHTVGEKDQVSKSIH